MISHIHIRNTICLRCDHYTPKKAFYEYEERLILYVRKAASLLHHRPFHPGPVQTGPSALLSIIIGQSSLLCRIGPADRVYPGAASRAEFGVTI
jgi:hypothetical protein